MLWIWVDVKADPCVEWRSPVIMAAVNPPIAVVVSPLIAVADSEPKAAVV